MQQIARRPFAEHQGSITQRGMDGSIIDRPWSLTMRQSEFGMIRNGKTHFFAGVRKESGRLQQVI